MAELSPLRRRMIEDMTVRNLPPAPANDSALFPFYSVLFTLKMSAIASCGNFSSPPNFSAQFLPCSASSWLSWPRHSSRSAGLEAENVALRHQLIVLRRKV
jgi:hypothetical protein